MSTALNAVDDSNPNNFTISQSDENVKLEQRVFVGSRANWDKDRPSLEYIGTGEGAQVHEVELKNKLADMFTTSYNTSTPASSKSIISKLIAEVNSDGKLYQKPMYP